MSWAGSSRPALREPLDVAEHFVIEPQETHRVSSPKSDRPALAEGAGLALEPAVTLRCLAGVLVMVDANGEVKSIRPLRRTEYGAARREIAAPSRDPRTGAPPVCGRITRTASVSDNVFLPRRCTTPLRTHSVTLIAHKEATSRNEGREETSMNQIDYLWKAQPPTVKLFLIALSTVFIISLVRFVRLARILSRSSGERILPENIVNGKVDPDRLAAALLANQELCNSLIGACEGALADSDRANTGSALRILRTAENRFLYLWEQCQTEMGSIKRASLFCVLLSAAMVTYAAFPVLMGNCNNHNAGGYSCVVVTAVELSVTLAFGLLLSALLYMGSSSVERKLDHRKASWKYLCSLLRNGLSSE